MRRTRYILIYLLTGIVLVSCTTGTGSTTPTPSVLLPDPTPTEGVSVRVGVFVDESVFVDRDTNAELTGFDIELMRAVATAWACPDPIEFVETKQWGPIFTQVQKGEFDIVISAATITEERAELVDFSYPYFNAGQIIVTRTDSAITGADDLAGRTVGVLTGSTGEEWAQENSAIEVTSYNEPMALFQAVAASDIAAAIYDAPAARSYIKSQAMSDLTTVGTPLTNEQYGIAVRPDRSDLLACVNEGLATMCSTDAYANIFTKWFGSAPDPGICDTINPAGTNAMPEASPIAPIPSSTTAATGVTETTGPVTEVCLRGSDTILGTGLASAWVEAFAPANTITITADGTEAAVEAAQTGTCVQILAASEALTADQIDQLAAVGISTSDTTIIGNDAIVFVTDPANPVTGLTLAQVAEILTGAVTAWDAVGGEAQPIEVLLRPGSGTTNEVLIEIADFEPFVTISGEPFPPDLSFTPCGEPGGNIACLEQAEGTPGAFYWSSKAVVPNYNLRMLPIINATGATVDPAAPTFDLSAYPTELQRSLYMYILNRDGAEDDAAVTAAEAFLQFILSEAGQQVLVAQGFLPR